MIATALAYVGCIGSLVAGMALNNVGRKSPRRIEAEQRGEIIDRAPTGGGDGVYDDYFAEFDDSHSRRDDRWGGYVFVFCTFCYGARPSGRDQLKVTTFANVWPNSAEITIGFC